MSSPYAPKNGLGEKVSESLMIIGRDTFDQIIQIRDNIDEQARQTYEYLTKLAEAIRDKLDKADAHVSQFREAHLGERLKFEHPPLPGIDKAEEGHQ